MIVKYSEIVLDLEFRRYKYNIIRYTNNVMLVNYKKNIIEFINARAVLWPSAKPSILLSAGVETI